MKLHRYPGPDFSITFNAERCIHAEQCVHGLHTVFNPQNRPWVNPAGGSAEEVAAVIRRCPTGALHFETQDVRLAETPDAENSVTISIDGPLYCRGDIRIVTKSGEVLLTDTRAALCRCGASGHKPLCDNAHIGAGFTDPGTPAVQAEEGAEAGAGGPLHVLPIVNGPLHITGNLCIKDAFGEVVFRGNETWLCRCGNSKGKPFCDGTHKKIGFVG